MAGNEIVEWLDQIVVGGIAITTTALQSAVEGQELTFTQWRAILIVGEHEHGCRVGDVASRMHAALPAASRLLRRLEQRGLLTLQRDEGDRRATRARLTQDGAQVRSSVLAYREKEIAAIVDGVKTSAAASRVLRDLAAQFASRGGRSATPRGQGRA